MSRLLRILFSWSARRILLFVLIVAALVAFVKAKEAYDRLPVLSQEIAALERQERLLGDAAASERARADAALGRIGQMEQPRLVERLAAVRAQIAALEPRRLSRTGFALEVVQGDAQAIARDLSAAFRLQLLQREEAALRARLDMLANGGRLNSARLHLARIDARIAAHRDRIAAIEREHPIVSRFETVPVLRDLQGPWRDLRAERAALAAAEAERARVLQMARAQAAAYAQAARAYEAAQAAARNVAAPVEPLRRRLAEKREEAAAHWASRLWQAVKPVLGWALWISIALILVPPAVKAFWFFLVAPFAQRLRPPRIRSDVGGDADWARDRIVGGAPASAVSRQVLIRPGEELLVRPDHLQSSVRDARIDSQFLLSPALPFGSLATGLVGLTRIRAERETSAAISSTRDLVDEIGLVELPEGSAMVLRPRSLVGIVREASKPLRIERVWTLGTLSSWLTLELRHIVFHGPCALILKGARGIALEPGEGGRRISGAATIGWTTGLERKLVRSETFLAYLTGKQSLFNDSFEGAGGKVVYEELPRARAQSGLFGRGLEGLGDAMLKIVGL